MFEEDYTPRFEQEIEFKGRLRKQLYETLYQEDYKWQVTGNTSNVAELTPAGNGQPRAASAGLAASAVNPETGTMDLPEGTKRADPAKSLPRVQSATSMEDLSEVLGTPLG